MNKNYLQFDDKRLPLICSTNIIMFITKILIHIKLGNYI